MFKFLNEFKTNRTSNYVSLSNGKYYIPIEKRTQFFNRYVSSYYENEYMYLVERVEYPCKLYIDIDGKNNICTSQIVKYILKEISSKDIMICKCTETDGYHIIFNDIILNSKDDIIQFLPETLKQYIDLSVYSSGLRMIGSRKPHLDRVYLPYKIIINNVSKKIKEKMSVDILMKCSINTHEKIVCKSSEHVVGSECPNKIQNTNDMKNMGNVHRCSQLFSLINENYRNVYITKIKRTKINNIIYTIFNTTSKYCINYEKEHNNAHIYFILTENNDNVKINQRCCCKCDIQRKHGLCSKYKSKDIELNFRMKCYFRLFIKNFID